MKSLENEKKSGVFISHSADEKEVALKIRSLLRNAFGKDFDVFISSDYRSIPGGDNWFESITRKLKTSKIVLVMLSKYSVDRRWINFEAGVGLGADARVIPIVFRNFDKDDVGRPLSLLQVRDTKVVKDLEGMLTDIATTVGSAANDLDIELFVDELNEIERNLPVFGVEMIPTLEYSGPNTYLHFRLANNGNRDIEPLQVWATIPQEIRDPSSSSPAGSPALKVDYDQQSTPAMMTKRQFAGIAVTGADYFGSFEILPALLVESMFPYRLPEMRLVLKRDLLGSESISFGVHVKSGSSFQREMKLEEIEGFKAA